MGRGKHKKSDLNTKIVEFIKSRPHFNLAGLEAEAGMPKNTLMPQLSRGRIPEKYLDALSFILKLYGFDENS